MSIQDQFPDVENADLVAELARQITERGQDIAHHLRRAADNVERYAADQGRSLHDMGPAFSRVATETTREVIWTMANLDLAGLVSLCAQADVAARVPQSAAGFDPSEAPADAGSSAPGASA